jgi:signal transduction histidine kinase
MRHAPAAARRVLAEPARGAVKGTREEVIEDSSELAVLRSQNAALEERVRDLEASVKTIRAEERARLRRELHDGLTQQLGGTVLLAKVHANALTAAAHPEAEQARELTQLIHGAVVQLRALMHDLAVSE